MIASFFLALREGLEAALIIGVLLGTLNKLDHSGGRRFIWLGISLAVVLSLGAAYLLDLAGAKFEGPAEEIFEGAAMLLAAGILSWMIIWMRTRARTMSQKLESGVQQAILKNSGWALFSLAFISVIREGIELALFLMAAGVDTERSAIILGAGLGFASVVGLAFLLFKSLVRLDLSRFFQVSGLILILFAAGLVAHGVHEFNEAGLIPAVIDQVWNINSILDEKSTLGSILKALLGYNGNPSLTEVAAYLLYFVVIWFSGFRFLEKDDPNSA